MQQRVEIIKALSHDAKLLVLDEPTAVLTPQETEELITVMRALRDAGTSIVFISHKLREVREVADKITVIRRGKVVGTAEPGASTNELAAMMVGRPVQLVVDKQPAEPGDAVLDVNGLRIVDDNGVVLVDDVTFSVRAGEIYAIAGVQGNGQTELTEALVGLTIPTSGAISIEGRADHLADDRRGARTSASGTCPRTGCTTGWSGRSRWPRTSSSTCTTRRRSPRAAASTSPRSSATRGIASRSSTCARR